MKMQQVASFSSKAKRWFVIAGVWAVMGAQSALLPSTWAAEAVCPGGSNPDPKVITCDDFEDGTWTDTWAVSSGDMKDPNAEGKEAVRCDGDNKERVSALSRM
jgi:hypothetical protein